MRKHDLASVFVSALMGVVGWTFVVVVAILAGIWLGTDYRKGSWQSFHDILPMIFVAGFLWPFIPQILAAWLASIVIWYGALKDERVQIRVGAGGICFIIWFGIFSMGLI